MTSEQLRSIFHVESQDLVPHYEVIHLTHHGTTEHKISKRSISAASSLATQHNNQFDDAAAQRKLSSHHVKKDLSKSAYYSELKKASKLPVSSAHTPAQSNSSESNSNSNSVSLKLDANSLSDSEFDRKTHELPSSRGASDDSDSDTPATRIGQLDLSNIQEHNVSLNVFGQVLNLTLRPTSNLFKNGPQSLQMFTVNVSPNATHGLAYEPVEEVSFLDPFLIYCLADAVRK